LERFLFSSGEIFYNTKPAKIPLNLLNSCIKRLLSDEFNMAAIKHSLTKSRSPQTLSCILRQKFYWGIFHLIWLILLICQQRFLFNIF